MIASAIDKILTLAKPEQIKVNGETYLRKNEYARANIDLRAEPIKGRTLSGLLRYMSDYKVRFNMWEGYFLHVENESTVTLISDLDNDRKREELYTATAIIPSLPVGTWYESETFLIGLQTNFIKDAQTDLAAVLKFAGTTTSGTIKEYSDDGVTQKATVKVGVSSKQEAIVPSPAVLRPYRTFSEVEQPASRFIFRMKEGSKGDLLCALYEADGGAWRKAAMENIRVYLEAELKKAGLKVSVIA